MKCERLMVPHPKGEHVCLGCEAHVQVKKDEMS